MFDVGRSMFDVQPVTFAVSRSSRSHQSLVSPLNAARVWLMIFLSPASLENAETQRGVDFCSRNQMVPALLASLNVESCNSTYWFLNSGPHSMFDVGRSMFDVQILTFAVLVHPSY
jgi:hypothetical protein